MRRLFDWFFRDRATGAVVVGQWPNLPLWLFASAAAAIWIVGAASLPVPGWSMLALQVVSIVGLAWWALDELVRGVNPWRRCLGGGVLLIGLWRLLGRF